MAKKAAFAALFLAFASGAFSQARITVPTGHHAYVSAVAFSADGRLVFSAADDGEVILWDYASGRELVHVRGVGPLRDRRWALSPDGAALYLAAGKTLSRWDLAAGKISGAISVEGEFGELAISPDGGLIATGLSSGGRQAVALWSASDLASRSWLEDGAEPLRFDAEGRLLYRTQAGVAKLASLPEGAALASYPGGAPFGDRFLVSPDGAQLVVLDPSGKRPESWDLATGKKQKAFASPPGRAVASLAYGPGGKAVAASSFDGKIRIWDARTGALSKSFDGLTGGALAFSPDGRYLVAGGAERTLVVYDAASGKVARSFAKYIGYDLRAADRGEALLVSGFEYEGSALRGAKRFARLFDPLSGRPLPSAPGLESAEMLAASPGLSFVLYSDDGKGAKLLDRAQGRVLRTYPSGFSRSGILAISEDGRRGISGADKAPARLWDLETGKALMDLPLKNGGLNDRARFSRDGSLVLFRLDGKPRSLALLEAETGRLVWRKDGLDPDSFALSPDGSRLLVGAGHAFGLYETRSGALLAGFKEADVVSALAFSPDGRLAATGSRDGALRIYDLEARALLRAVEGHSGWVQSLSFSADARRLFSASTDGTVRAWEAATGRELARFFAFPDGSWATVTPEGYFEADAAGARRIDVVDGLARYAIDQFFEAYHRPDIVAARLQLRQAAAERARELVREIASPPELRLSVKTKGGSFAPVAEGAEIDLSAPRGGKAAAGPDWLVEDGSVTLRVSAEDRGGGVDGLRLYVDGKAWGEDLRGLAVQGRAGALATRDYVLRLGGDAEVAAVGFSRDRVESSPFTARLRYSPPKAAPERPAMWVLVAAADEYQNPKYRLNYALADASGFVSALAAPAGRLFSRVEVVRLLGGQLSREGLLAALGDIRAKARPEDVFVFFYAGHGIALPSGKATEFWFVTPEVTNMADPERLERLAVPGALLRDAMAAIPASKQLLLVDACNSGAFAEGFAARGAAEDIALAQLSRSSGAAVISATTDAQYAAEVDKLGHGVFTYALLEGLGGKAAKPDGRITAGSLRAWMEDQLPELAREYRGVLQYPTAFIFGQDFPLGIRE